MDDRPKLKIVVLHVGALPGKTNGDIVENPTDEQIIKAKVNPGLLRLVELEANKDR